MLSAFTARPIVEFKQRDKSKIESILAYGDKVLVGLNTGALRIYRIHESVGTEPDATPTAITEAAASEPAGEEGQDGKDKRQLADLLREEEKFSRRAITQLAIVKEANILVSLADAYVSLHDLQTYALIDRLERTKGASAFAVTSNIVKDAESGIPQIVSRLCAAVKRKLVLWQWRDMEIDEEVREISLPASVKSLHWATGTKVLVGMDLGFSLVDVETQEATEVNKPNSAIGPGDAGSRFGAINSSGMSYVGMGGWVPKPLATKLQDDAMLLAKDVNTLFINAADGKPVEKRQIPWAQAPEAIGYSYPFLLALQPAAKGAVEVRNPDTLNLLQTIPLPGSTILHMPQPNISLAHAAKGFLVASERTVWRMGALNYDQQIDELVARGRYDEAISLLNMLEDTLLKDKAGRLRDVQILKAHELFEARKFRQAFECFSEARAPPAKVIPLYPQSIAGDISLAEQAKDETGDGAENSSVKDGKIGKQEHEAMPSSPPSKSILSLGFGIGGHKRAESDTSSIFSGAGGSVFDGSPSKSKDSLTTGSQSFQGKDFAVAVNELCRFLVQIHGQLLKVLDADGAVKESPLPTDRDESTTYQAVKHLFAEPADSDWPAQLKAIATLVDTTLFKAYMLVNPGLAGSLFRLANFCDPGVVQEKLYESSRYTDLVDFLQGKKLHREALELLTKFGKAGIRGGDEGEAVMPQLRGPRRTVQYLQQLPPEMIDVILQFAEWPLRVDHEMGMEVFLADTENAETLPRDRVLEFLTGVDESLATQYLEHIIDELNDTTPAFHQTLVEAYLKPLKDKSKSEEEASGWRSKLLGLLEKSSGYNKWKTLQALPTDDPDFYEARAIVLSKMGQHKQALSIYVFQMQAYEKAEDYCNRVYLAEQQSNTLTPKAEDSEPTIYHTLLTLYLSPSPPQSSSPALLRAALSLLSHHGARLPASQTLSLLPGSLPLQELYAYFQARLRAATSAAAEQHIAARLRGVEARRAEAALARERGRRVRVADDTVCPVCLKRFGGAAIRVLPRSEAAKGESGVVHYVPRKADSSALRLFWAGRGKTVESLVAIFALHRQLEIG